MDQSESQQGQAPNSDRSSDPTPSTDPLSRIDTRREFVTGIGKKLLYVTPVVLTLAASQAQAATGSAPAS